MADKWLLVCFAHYGAIALLLKISAIILPYSISGYYRCAAELLLYLFVARITLRFTKQWFLEERIQPDNRAVFITGCDTGFGHHLAEQLDAKGFQVFAGCLDPSGAGAKKLVRICSSRLQIVGADVTQDESISKAEEFVRENLGTSELWAVVNNAGIQQGFHSELSPLSDFKACLEVNTLGPIRVTKAFLPLLRQSRGRVVNVASLAGRVPSAYITPYTVSKYAVVGFSGCLRQEMAEWGIKVVSIEPEAFKTNIIDPEVIFQKAKSMVDNVEPIAREDYGEEFLRSLPTSFQVMTKVASSDINPVLEAMEDAISLEYPDSIYKPSRNILVNGLVHLLGWLPENTVDLLFKVHCTLFGIPKPKEAENYL